MSFARFAVLVLLFIKPVLAGEASPLTFQSGGRKVALLELYTSEGCSSCPPAETWLSKLKADPKLWREVVPVAFHVDYWDYLGWRDRFGSRANTDRQRRLAQTWPGGSVYTPGFALDGKEWKGWFSTPVLPAREARAAGELTVTRQGDGRWQTSFKPASPLPKGCLVHAVMLGFGLGVDVKAGENAGRKLEHDFVALAVTRVPARFEPPAWTAELQLDYAGKEKPGRMALAAWVTAADGFLPLQATGGWLPAPGK